MAKSDTNETVYDVSEILNMAEKMPAVYDAKQYTNRPFILREVKWQVFDASERNGYNSSEKLTMTCDPTTGEVFKIDTSQKGVTYPIAAIEKAQALPCRIMIVPKGKYLTVVAK